MLKSASGLKKEGLVQKFERSAPSRAFKAKQIGMEQHSVLEVLGPVKELRLEQRLAS